MGLGGLLNSKKCICCLLRSSKQDLSFCLVEVLFSFSIIMKMFCIASRKNVSLDSLMSVENAEVWAQYWIKVMGLISPDTEYL